MTNLTIPLPNREETLAFHRDRWAEVLRDGELAKLSGRIETNAYGQVVMSPPPAMIHGSRQSRIAYLIQQLLSGRTVTECPVITSDGVKGIDVGWYSDQRYAEVCEQVAGEIAPEICVEVLSPSNTEAEMRIKRQLYFDAGAEECWQCDEQGTMTYYTANEPETAKQKSLRCPDFPDKIEDK